MKHIPTANDVANFFINFCHEHGDCLTNLKLQKLLYFSQGWFLTFYDKPLFEDEIQAWVHGPVVPSVYRRFKDYQYNPISEATNPKEFSDQIKNHLVNVFEYYGKYSAYNLEKISHGSMPWMKARGSLPPDEPSTNQIDVNDMKEYYKSLWLDKNG